MDMLQKGQKRDADLALESGYFGIISNNGTEYQIKTLLYTCIRVKM